MSTTNSLALLTDLLSYMTDTGVSIHPMGFLVCGKNGVRLLSAGSASPMERVAELIPQALENWKRLGDEEENAKPSPVRAAYQE